MLRHMRLAISLVQDYSTQVIILSLTEIYLLMSTLIQVIYLHKVKDFRWDSRIQAFLYFTRISYSQVEDCQDKVAITTTPTITIIMLIQEATVDCKMQCFLINQIPMCNHLHFYPETREISFES